MSTRTLKSKWKRNGSLPQSATLYFEVVVFLKYFSALFLYAKGQCNIGATHRHPNLMFSCSLSCLLKFKKPILVHQSTLLVC